jgi:hypothetical protein
MISTRSPIVHNKQPDQGLLRDGAGERRRAWSVKRITRRLALVLLAGDGRAVYWYADSRDARDYTATKSTDGSVSGLSEGGAVRYPASTSAAWCGCG